MCATTAISKTFAKRSNRLLATTQIAPLRTLAESDLESFPATFGSETSLPGGSDVAVMPSQLSQAEAKRPQLHGLRRSARASRHSPQS
jgi:hypothetical protein